MDDGVWLKYKKNLRSRHDKNQFNPKTAGGGIVLSRVAVK